MGNPYFQHAYDPGNNEETLYKNATDELCEMFGIDFKYITKTLIKPDHIFGEDTLKQFETYKPITFLIENYENYEGVDNLFSKFGFEVDNRLILLIEQSRFTTYVGQDPEIDDLVYHPNSQKIFKVVHIQKGENFYQMNGGQDRYRITCELFTPSHEEFDTNISDIDILNNEDDSNNTLERDQFSEEVNDLLDLSESDLFENL